MKYSVIAIYVLAFLFVQNSSAAKLEKATFAGGCFWCMEPPFEKLEGVISVISGFSGGKIKNPTYEKVAAGQTKHLESVQVTYDPEKISYSQLLKVFWVNIDPTDSGGQFVDRGHQYSTAIFYHDKAQRDLAEKSKNYLTEKKILKSQVLTPIREFVAFYPAEEYHQDFYKKTLVTKAKYKYYRAASGRDDFINKHWKGVDLGFDKVSQTQENKKKEFIKPNKNKLKAMLTELQYKVTQKNGTERPFDNLYWKNKEEGIYVDIVSGEPLFSSKDKYDSGTGWPSFTKPLVKENIVEREDNTLFSRRTEVRSRHADSHLGHVFNDGPAPHHLRYCINSAALKFIKKAELAETGYKEYIKVFK